MDKKAKAQKGEALGAEKALWEAISAGTPSESVISLARMLSAAGRLNLAGPVGYGEAPLLAEWARLSAGGLSWRAKLDEDQLGELAALHGKPIAGADGAPLAEVVARELLHGSQRDEARGDELLSKAIELAPAGWAARATMPNRWNDTPRSILEWALVDGKLPRASMALIAAGAKLAGAKNSDGVPLVVFAQTAEQWEAFLAQGGDPLERFEALDRNDKPFESSVWEALRERGRGGADNEASRLAVEWAKEGAKEQLAARQEEEYWAGFARSSDKPKHMKSRKDWAAITGPGGITAPMALALARASDHKAFTSVAKSDAAAARSDDRGRNLWWALMRSGKTLDSTAITWLVNKVPLAADNEGLGVAGQCLLDPRQNEHESLRMSAALVRATGDNVEGWWGTPERQRELGRWLIEERYWPPAKSSGMGTSSTRLSEQLSMFSASLSDEALSRMEPALLGALALNEIANWGREVEGTKSSDRARRLMAAGALIGPVPEQAKEGLARSNGLAEEILALEEANILRASLGSGAGAPRSGSPRL